MLNITGSRLPNWPKALTLFVSLLCLFLGQFQIFNDPSDAWLKGGYTLMAVGLAGFFLVARRPRPFESKLVTQIAPGSIHIRWFWIGAAAVLTAILCTLSTIKPVFVHFGVFWLLWIGAMGTLIAAVYKRAERVIPRQRNAFRNWEYALLAAIFVLAVLSHASLLGSVPYLLDQDEAVFAQEGAYLRVAENNLVNPFEPGFHSYPLLYATTISVSTEIWGNTLLGARVPAAILGVLGVIAIYLLGRELAGWKVGFIAALFTAGWSYHILFSHLALNQPGDPLFATLSFYFLLRGLRLRSQVDYVLAGIMLGVAQMFYLGGRLAVLVCLAYLIWLWMRDREWIRRQGRALLLFPFAFMVVTLPQNFYLLYFNLSFTTHTEPSLIFGTLSYRDALIGPAGLGDFLRQQFGAAFTRLFSTADYNGWYGLGSNLMGFVGGPFLVIGVLMSLVWLRRYPKTALALGWALAVIIGGVALTLYGPYYQRYFPGISALAILVGIGGVAVAHSVAHAFPRFHVRNVATATILIGGLLFGANLLYYYFRYIPGKGYIANRANWVANRIAREAADAQAKGEYIVLLTDFQSQVANSPVLKYAMLGHEYRVLDGDLNQDELDKLDKSKNILFIIAPRRFAKIGQLVEQFPNGKGNGVILDEDGSLAFGRYEYAPDSAPTSPNADRNG